MTDTPTEEPERIETVRYRCRHCRRTWAHRAAAAAHIARCWLNPAAQSCKTCRHRVEERDQYGQLWGEDCRAGVELPTHPYRENVIVLPLHCPSWEAAHASA